ncbi:MAG: hypothetical protein M1824_001987 [Vezdaea acicularis]|nr:MAG: hypothetical protein M1824_001987 [Vezdaea acicularis]
MPRVRTALKGVLHKKQPKPPTSPPPPQKSPTLIRDLSFDTSTQSNSPLLGRLPPEIRNIIYEYVLCDNTFHLCWAPKKTIRDARHPEELGVCHMVGSIWDTPQPGWIPLMRDAKWWQRMLPIPKSSPKRADFAFLRTCKQVYIEAIDLFYSNNLFEFHNDATFVAFLDGLPPAQALTVQHVQLSWILHWDWVKWRPPHCFKRNWMPPVDRTARPVGFRELWDALGMRTGVERLTIRVKDEDPVTVVLSDHWQRPSLLFNVSRPRGPPAEPLRLYSSMS